MRARRAWLAAFAAAVVAVPLTTTSSLASWNDREWVEGSLQTTEFDGGTQTGYTATAESQQVSGTLLGDDILGILALENVADANGAKTTILEDQTEDPAGSEGSQDLDGVAGANEFHARAATLSVDALSLLGLSLPQIGLIPVDGLDVGVLAQYARASTFGLATGATGLIADGTSSTIAIGEDVLAPGTEPPARRH